MTLTLLIAPSGFKESLLPWQAAGHMAEGARRALPHARIIQAPVVDGGEGFTEGLVHATGGSLRTVDVSGPVGQRLQARLGFLGDEPGTPLTAVVEVAAAAGLRWVPADRRNPLHTCSRGVGELIRAALDAGARRILLGCGDSGINDGGAGMAQALGARLLDAQGNAIAPGAAGLQQLAHIDLSGLDPRLRHTQLDAAVNWQNQLLGPRGVARVHGPQKGATHAQVVEMEVALNNFARHLHRATGIDVSLQPGSGASGGLGAGFCALLGGRLHPRYEVVMQYLDLDRLMDRCHLVLTAEGQLDDQTPRGKVPAEVARRAKQRGLPVIAVAGSLGPGADSNHAVGIDAYTSTLREPCSLDDAFRQAGPWLADATEQALRMVAIGMGLSTGPVVPVAAQKLGSTAAV